MAMKSNTVSYLNDFLKHTAKKQNATTIVWIALNVLVISLTFGALFANGHPVKALIAGIIIYFLTVVAVLSPFGEWVCRLQSGCKQPTDEVKARLQPILDEVLAAARSTNPELPEVINLYINEDEEPNAFALGRKTVCCTKGLLQYSDEEIRAIFGHEIGHIAHHDTDLILVVTGGNLIINLLFLIVRFVFRIFVLGAWFIGLFIPGVGGLIYNLVQNLFTFITAHVLGWLMNAWVRLGIWLTMKSSREEEFEADAFSCNLGFSNGLLQFFQRLQRMEQEANAAAGVVTKKSFFKALEDSHPETSLRIERICAIADTSTNLEQERK